MPEILPFDVVALVSIDGSNVGNSPLVQGCTLTDVGIGRYQLTLPDGGVDRSESIIQGTITGGANGFVRTLHISDTVKEIVTTNPIGELVDLDIDVTIYRTKRVA